jgi:hypothetical protein
MKKRAVRTVLLVLIGAVSLGVAQDFKKPPILKCDLTVVSWKFKDVMSATVAGGKVAISFKLAATVKNLGPGPAPASKLHFL